MTIKLIVASRIESITKEGPRTQVMLLGEESAVKMEIAQLDSVTAQNFPLGRKLEVTVPPFTNNRSSLVIPSR